MITKDQNSIQLNILKEKIAKVRIAMMTTTDSEGNFNSRPMECQAMDTKGRLWFFTSGDSGKNSQIRNDERVHLAFCSPSEQTYISISGEASIVEDQERINELFTTWHKAWFPNGPDSENVQLICFAPTFVEYWDVLDFKLVQWFKIAKALFKGEKYVPGEYSKFETDVKVYG